MLTLIKRQKDAARRLTVLLACLGICFLSMEQALGSPLGTIANVLLGGFEIFIRFVVWLSLMFLGVFIDLSINTMSFDWGTLESYLGNVFTFIPTNLNQATNYASSRVAAFLVVLGFAMYAVFLVAEIAKIPLATIIGEERGAVRPGALAVRGIMYGAAVIAAMPFAKFVLIQAGHIYNALFNTYLGKTLAQSTAYDAVMDKFASMKETFQDITQLEISAFENDKTFVEAVTNCVTEILSFVILLIVVWNLAKLVLECAQRIGQLLLLIYMSPLAVSCGVSPSLSGIATQWFKTFISTLLLWIMDIIVLAGAMAILRGTVPGTTGDGASRQSWLIWAFLAFAYMKAGQQLDDLFNAIGASVVRSSGSLLGDFMEMSHAGQVISGAAKTAFGAVKGIASETGKFTSGALAGAAGKPGQLRKPGQVFNDSVKSGIKATSAGQAIAKQTQGLEKLMATDLNVRKENNMFKAATADAKQAETMQKSHRAEMKNLEQKYRDPKTGKLPEKGTQARTAFDNEKAKLMARQSAEMSRMTPMINGNPVLKDNLAKEVRMNGKTMEELGYKCDSVSYDNNTRYSASFSKVDPNTGAVSTVKFDNIQYDDDGYKAGTLSGGYSVAGDEKANIASYSQIDENGSTKNYTVSEVDANADGTKSYRVDELNENGQVVSSNIYTGADENTSVLDVAQGLADQTYSSVKTIKNDDGEIIPEVKQIQFASYQGNGAMFGMAEVKSTTHMSDNYENGDHVVRVSYENIHGVQDAEIATGSVDGQNYSYFMNNDGEIRIRSIGEDVGDINSDVATDIINESSVSTGETLLGEHVFDPYLDGSHSGAYEVFSGQYEGNDGLFIIAGTGDSTVIDFRQGASASNGDAAVTRAKEIISGSSAPSDGYQRIFASERSGADGLFEATSKFDSNKGIRNVRRVTVKRVGDSTVSEKNEPLMFGKFFKHK